MKKAVWNFMKIIIGQRCRSFCREYSEVPRLLFQELRQMLTLIRCRRQHIDDAEVLLCRLRTSAHILDKGMQTDNWEQGHGQIEYDNMCKYVDVLKESTLSVDPSYQWAVEKKAEYEELQKSGLTGGVLQTNEAATRFAKEDLLHLIQNRRSIRSFEQRRIEPGILKELANVISWSPTSCNRQPAKLFITQNHEKISACLKQCAGATCLGAIPCFIAVCADSRFYTLQDRNLQFIDVSLGLQNMLLMAHLQGIEGTVLNWMHHTSQEDAVLRKVLRIPEYYTIVVNLIIGYSTKSTPIPRRKGRNLSYSEVK